MNIFYNELETSRQLISKSLKCNIKDDFYYKDWNNNKNTIFFCQTLDLVAQQNIYKFASIYQTISLIDGRSKNKKDRQAERDKKMKHQYKITYLEKCDSSMYII
jgi:hypothetical protein